MQSIDQSIDLPLFSVREDANAGLPNWRRESSTNESAFFEHDCLVRWLVSRQTETKVRNERERERERERENARRSFRDEIDEDYVEASNLAAAVT